jgi:8-hydroxy-5-deazaflavin:NADPH oxidoreductase
MTRSESRVIAVVGGTGQQGRGIAQRLIRGGHAVVVGSRDPARASSSIAEWPADARPQGILDYESSIRRAQVTILAVPFAAATALLDAHRAAFTPQSLVIDLTVPLSFAAGKVTLVPVEEGSAAEHVRARLPETVRVAGTFKTVPAHLLEDIDRSLDCDEFVCGDSDGARADAMALVSAMKGLRPIDVGPLGRARAIEHLTLLAIAINRKHKIHDARFRMVGL